MNFDQLELNLDFSQLAGVDRHRVIIAYDSPDNRRRRRLARAAKSYATRVQRSVFEADLTDVQLRILCRTLESEADSEDDIRLYPQCARCAELCCLIGSAMPIPRPVLVVA